MESLDDLRRFEFKGYDTSKVESTKENIKNLQKEAEQVWNSWVNSGIKSDEPIEVEFEFHTSDRDEARLFSELLLDNEYEVILTSKRSFILLKEWKVNASYKDIWTLQKLKDTIEKLGLLSRKHNIEMERFGGSVNK